MAKLIKKENPNIVWSDDGSHLKKEKPKATEVVPSEICLRMRLEKKGRGGKTVTVIYDFPNNEEYFKKLAKELKTKCGTGGSFKEDSIEIQGDHKQKLKEILEKRGFSVKISGG